MTEAPFEAIRPLLVSVDGTEVVRVALEYGRELYVADSPVNGTGAEGRARASASATAGALGQLTPEAVKFTAEWCALIEPGPSLPTIASALVGVDVSGSRVRYAGAVVVTDDVAVAAAKAVLDALNRRLGVTGL